MDTFPLQLPVRIAGLIIGFVCNTLTETEKEALNDWVCEKDDNLTIFEQLLDRENPDTIQPEQYLDRYHELMELWVVSGWMAKRELNAISEYELEEFTNWLLNNPERIIQMQKLKSYHNRLNLSRSVINARKN